MRQVSKGCFRAIFAVRSAYGVTRNLPFVQDRKDCRAGVDRIYSSERSFRIRDGTQIACCALSACNRAGRARQAYPRDEWQKRMGVFARYFDGSVIHIGVHHVFVAPPIKKFLQVIFGSADCSMILFDVVFVV